MPRYFFHLIGDEPPLIDVDGIELPDIEAARMSAVYEAREIMKAGLFEGSLPLHLRFDVTDRAGALVMTVPFGKTVRVQLPTDEAGARRLPVARGLARRAARASGVNGWLAAAAGATAGLMVPAVDPLFALLETSPAPTLAVGLTMLASIAWLRSQLLRY